MPLLRTILSCSKSRTPASTSEWYAYEVVHWSSDDTRSKKDRPEFRVFETFADQTPEGITNGEMHFSARCQADRLEVLASKVVRNQEAEEGEEEMRIAFIAYIPIEPEHLDQAKAFLAVSVSPSPLKTIRCSKSLATGPIRQSHTLRVVHALLVRLPARRHHARALLRMEGREGAGEAYGWRGGEDA